MMRKVMGSAAVAILMVAMIPFDAEAFPIGADLSAGSSITLVAGGCGPGFHRRPYGACVRNWGRGSYPYAWHRCWVRETLWGPRRVCR
jgi:hypothetical protein